MFDTRPTEEFYFGMFNDPFLQIRLLQGIAVLKSPSDDLDDVLSAIVTGVDIQRNSGRSLLLSAVTTIGQSAKKSSLRSLAFNQVGRLFTFPQPNLLYSALSMFSNILYSNSTIIDRGSSDAQVLQRYKSQVVRCLNHRDPSIRRRALDVVTALVDETNFESLIPEIMGYLKLANRDFRTQLVAKVFTSVQRFAPSSIWNFDTVLRLLKDSGNYVGNDVITAFCTLIARNLDIRQHAMDELYLAIQNEVDTQPLIQVAAWALGEFLDPPSDVPEILIRLLPMPQTTPDTRCYLLTALAKLAVRFGTVSIVRPVFEKWANQNHLEIQQRAGELLRVLDKTALCKAILAPVEVDEAELGMPVSTSVDDVRLLELGPAPLTQPVVPEVAIAEPPPLTEPQPPPGAVEAQRTADYVIYFQIQRNANNPRQIAIKSTVFGLGAIPLTQFLVHYGVPQGWGIAARAPSSSVLEGKGGRPIQQIMILENRGVNPLTMLTQVNYLYRTQPIQETGRINPIFD
jgi:hypothetical protein